MKKSEWKVVAVLACVVIILSSALAAVSRKNETASAPDYLLDITADDIVKLDFANGTDYIHLEKKNSAWTMQQDETFPVDQSSVTKLLAALVKTKVESEVKVGSQTELNNYSLLSPQCIIEYTEKTGKTHSVRIGVMNSMTENLYINLDEDSSTVYVTDAPMAQAFSCTKNDLMKLPEIPTPASGQCAVTIKNLYGTVELYKEEDKWYVKTENGPEKVDEKTAYNYYFLTWDMHWRDIVEHNAQDLKKYDLARPRISYSLTYIENGEEKVFDLELGSSLPDGKCYARIKDSNDIFMLDSLMADWLESTKTEALYELQK